MCIQPIDSSARRNAQMGVNMKKFKKFASLLAVTALVAAFPGSKMMTVSAQTPTTFCVAYDSDDNDWYYQRDSSTWNVNIERKEAFQLKDVIQNGDIVVVEGASSDTGLNLDISNVRLSNLTFKNASTVIVTTAGVDACYVLNGTVAAINGDVTKAEVYDISSVTFNNNVADLKIIGTNDIHSYVSAGGTVGHVLAVDENRTYYEYYDVASGKLDIEDGGFHTDSAYYSETPSASSGTAQTTQPAAQNPAPAAQPAPAPAASSAGEYDHVPKTGEGAPVYLWFMGIAAVCFAGKLALKKV